MLAGLATLLRLAGLVLIVVGLWKSSGGMRVIVSGRIDERKRASQGLRMGLPLLGLGLAVAILGMWLASLGHS